ncbi:uncharacterized protein LOC114521572 [Dendronephthya gigantea]|uniref:uncharacterized protein LOC114521572 n=1 Tax=Dendronephthya gigantea TaxID=151771 RepID=UPI00106B01F8|nr:uncharacterized protein LOC114521572 [Dendronephthya gigantea]
MTDSRDISVSGESNITNIGDYANITIIQPPQEAKPAGRVAISNCHEPLFSYYPRREIDDKIKRIEKGRPKTLHGTIGTGKTSAALHYINENKEKYAVSWYIDVSVGEGSIIDLSNQLAKKDVPSTSLPEVHVSYRQLFTTIKEIAKNKDVIFMLDNVERKPSAEWFRELWNIRHSVYMIITTNNPSLSSELPDAEELQVGEFDEAEKFLREIRDKNSNEDLSKLCKYFESNILGLSVAKDYILRNKMTVNKYLKLLSDKKAAEIVHRTELSKNERTLYAGVRATFEQVDEDKLSALATISFISIKMIPEFFLSSQLSSGSYWENVAILNDLHDQLKSLVLITVKNDLRFFSFHSFTQHVLRDMIDESTKYDLMYKLAGIFIRYIGKDNRFSMGDFLQRTVREHAEIFLGEWENKEKNDRTTIALVRLSELVGFTYTQQQPPMLLKLDFHFQRARRLLHKLCGITKEDLKPSDGIVQKLAGQFKGLLWGQSVEEMYGITNDDLVAANQLFTKLFLKSSELSPEIVKELVFSRTVNKQDLSIFPGAIKRNKKVLETIESSQPLSPDDVKLFIKHGAAYSVDAYKPLFLPELYLSLIYSFGRNYFYQKRATMKNPSFYTNLLKLAYCLSVEISKKMNADESVFHEYLVQSNALLYLLVNDDFHDEDGKYKKKDAQAHARDLKNAIYRYQQLINEKRKFFEIGILKKTEDDTYSKLICYQQILRCFDTLLSLPDVEDRDEHINVGVKLCDDLLPILDEYTALEDPSKEELVRYSRHLNAVGKFYLNIKRDECYSSAINIFTISAKQAEKSDLSYFHLEALVCLADIFCRQSKHRDSSECVRKCYSTESLREMLHQKPHLQEQIQKISEQIRPQCSDGSDAKAPNFFDDSDASDNEEQPEEEIVLRGATHDEPPLSQDHVNENSQPSSSLPDSQNSHPNSNAAYDEVQPKEEIVLEVATSEELPLSQDRLNDNSQPAPSLRCSQDSHPDSNDKAMDTHLLILADKIPGEWKKLAKFLKVGDNKIEEISLNHPGNVVWQAYMMLKLWWNSNCYLARPRNHWREKLRRGLSEIDRNDLAERFTGDVLQTNQ